jgi:exosortase
MIPLPTLVFDRMTQSLQLVASGFGERLLRAADYAVLRDGNVLTLSSITLQVTDACSGIRSLMSLLTVSSLIAYFFEPTQIRRLLLTSTAVPLAIVLNGLRVAFTGIAASRFGPEMARGFLHETSGWVVFVAGFAAVWMLHRALSSIGARGRAPVLIEAA